MDNTEDDASYPPDPYDSGQDYEPFQRPKFPIESVSNPLRGDDVVVDNEDEDDVEDVEDDDDNVVEEEEEEEEEIKPNGRMKKNESGVDEDDDDNEDEDEEEEEEEEDDDDDDDAPNGYNTRRIQDVDLERHQKKRKLKSLLSSYEFAPRVVAAASASKPSFGGRNSLTDWTEHESFVLLDAWGDRFLKHGRKSVRSEEWQEVAEKVSEESKITRTDTQCRNRLDTLKKKYKKEKIKLAESKGTPSKWVYFCKMDMLMSPSSSQQPGISRGLDLGTHVFVNSKVHFSRAKSSDEMRDSPVNSEFAEGENDDLDELPSKRIRMGRGTDDRASFKLLADSIHKFSEMYEKIEYSKRQQLVELERMRMDFQRDLELQKRKILERAQAEIAKIWRDDCDDNDLSAENVSG